MSEMSDKDWVIQQFRHSDRKPYAARAWFFLWQIHRRRPGGWWVFKLSELRATEEAAWANAAERLGRRR